MNIEALVNLESAPIDDLSSSIETSDFVDEFQDKKKISEPSFSSVSCRQYEEIESSQDSSQKLAVPHPKKIANFLVRKNKLILNQFKLHPLEFHPYTIARLCQFHQQRFLSFNCEQILTEFSDLVGLLCEEQQQIEEVKLSQKIASILFPHNFVHNSCQNQRYSISQSDCKNSELILYENPDFEEEHSIYLQIRKCVEKLCKKVLYAEHIYIWEICNLTVFPEPLANAFKNRRNERLKNSVCFLEEYHKNFAENENLTINEFLKSISNTELSSSVSSFDPILLKSTPTKRKLDIEEIPGKSTKKSVDKQKKVSQFFSFIKNDSSLPASRSDENNLFDEFFKPFFLKEHTKLAPINRFLLSDSHSSLNLSSLNCTKNSPIENFKCWIKEYLNKKTVKIDSDKKGKIIGLSSGDEATLAKFKLFQFHDNYRPPYFGTFQKKPLVFLAKNPFLKEPTINYDVDSDEEWEEEELGDVEIIESDEEEFEEEEIETSDDEDFCVDDDYISGSEADLFEQYDENIDTRYNCLSTATTPKKKAADSHYRWKSSSSKNNFVSSRNPVNYDFVKNPNFEDGKFLLIFYTKEELLLDPFAEFSLTTCNSSTDSTGNNHKKQNFPSHLVPFLVENIFKNQTIGLRQLHEMLIQHCEQNHPTSLRVILSKKLFEETVFSLASKEKHAGKKSVWKIIAQAE